MLVKCYRLSSRSRPFSIVTSYKKAAPTTYCDDFLSVDLAWPEGTTAKSSEKNLSCTNIYSWVAHRLECRLQKNSLPSRLVNYI